MASDHSNASSHLRRALVKLESTVPDEKGIASYVYDRLPSTDHFRLIRLSPRSASQLLQISLHTFHHLKCPSYTAVSYTWGTNRIQHKILITRESWLTRKHFQMHIGSQAHDVLEALQTPTARWIWLDAICIDQTCLSERSQQVKLMATIYGYAHNVTAWLGQEDDTSDTHASIRRAFDYIDRGLRHAVALNETMLPGQTINDGLIQAQVPLVAWHSLSIRERPIDKPWDTDEERAHFDVFCTREYWRRKWIIQELVISQVVMLQHGTSALPMTTVEDFFHYWNQVISPVERLAMHCFYNRKRQENPHSLYYYFPGTLRVLIATYFDQECSIPIDHVYALISLATNRHLLPINYESTTAQQLMDVLRFLHEAEELETKYLFKWAAALCKRLELQPSQMQHLEVKVRLHLAHAGHFDFQPDCAWAEACREIARPIRSIEHIHCLHQADACPADERALWHERAASFPAWTLPADMRFFKLRYTCDSYATYGLADKLEVGDIILLPGQSRVALIARQVDGRTAYIGFAWLFSGDPGQIRTLLPTFHYADLVTWTGSPLVEVGMRSTVMLELASIVGEMDGIRHL